VDRPQRFVDTPDQLAACVEDVGRSARIGLDTESNGFHAYFEKVCLLQIATPEADWAVDTLTLAIHPLLPLLADPARECVLHAAEYDVLCMKRDHGLSFGRIFDTHAAAKTLGIERVGLHHLLEDQLGTRIEVDEQRSDWGRRPLSPRQLEYAFADVRFLLSLREKLGEQLAARGLSPEAEAEFARLIAKEPRPREFDPEGWQRMKAARALDGRGRAVLRELYLLRDRRARELDRPAFKVLSDLFLAEAARRVPRSQEELLRIPGTSAVALQRVGPQVLAAVKKGAAAEPLPRPRPAGNGGQRWRRGSPGAPSAETEERYERLRRWRKARALARKVEVQVIAPNSVLWAIARSHPPDLDALGRVEGMDAYRLEQYGAEILQALRADAPSQGQLFEQKPAGDR
jgi:ribonuclease D